MWSSDPTTIFISSELNLCRNSLLILAGTDTTSNALTATMDTLGRRNDVQEKLLAEILESQDRNGGDIPYDELVALPYLDSICREILRLYVKSFESM